MRYLRRDKDGKVTGHFANPNPDALEEVPDDHPDIVVWNTRRAAEREAALRRKTELDPEAMLRRIEALEAKFK